MPTPIKTIYEVYDFVNGRGWYGNPNGAMSGLPGYTVQDWTNGALYVCTAEGNNNWAKLATGDSLPVGANYGDVLYWDGTAWLANYAFKGSEGIASLSPVERRAYGADEQIVIDWGTCTLLDPVDNFVTVNWTGGYLAWGEEASVDWAGRTLKTGANATLDWVNGHTFDNFGTKTIDWMGATLCDPAYGGNATLNWTQTQLIATDSSLITLNWNVGELYDSAGDYSLQWQTRSLWGAWVTSESGSYTSGNVMSMASYFPTIIIGTYNPAAPANAGMSIYHVASTNALIASMTLSLHGATSAIDSVPVGGVVSFTSRYGITTLTMGYGSSYTVLGTAVTTIAAGATVQWRKVESTTLARIS